MSSAVDIGRLNIFRAERLGSGRFGRVFTGKFKCFTEEIAIKRMRKRIVKVDSNLYLKANEHPNVIGYYGIECSTKRKFM